MTKEKSPVEDLVAMIANPKVAFKLAPSNTYPVAESGETRFPETFPGWVEATLTDGRRLVERIDVNAGHPDSPLSMAQVLAKFRDNSLDALGESGIERVEALVTALPHTSASELGCGLSTLYSSIPQSKRKIS